MSQVDAEYVPPLMGNESFKLVNVGNEGFWNISVFVPNILKCPNFLIREDDVFVVSYPKSGITWLNEIVYLLMNNLDVNKAQSDIQDTRVPFLESSCPEIGAVNNYPSPRQIKTHVNFNTLPKGIFKKQTKVIYMVRNPKDNSVSLYHFYRFMNRYQYKGKFEDFFEDFITGKVIFGSWFEHVAPFWENRNKENIHFIFYEELIKNTIAEVAKLASFLAKDYSNEQIQQVVNFCSFNNMKTNPSANFAHFEETGKAKKASAELQDEGRIGLLRKGVVGDWENYYSSEMSDRLDELVTEKLKSVGLEYCYKTHTWTKQ